MQQRILLAAKNAAAMASAIAAATVLRPATAAIAPVPRRIVPRLVVPLLVVPAARPFSHAPRPPVPSLMRRPHRPSGPRCTRPRSPHPSLCAAFLCSAPLLAGRAPPCPCPFPSSAILVPARPCLEQQYVSCCIKKALTNKAKKANRGPQRGTRLPHFP